MTTRTTRRRRTTTSKGPPLAGIVSSTLNLLLLLLVLAPSTLAVLPALSSLSPPPTEGGTVTLSGSDFEANMNVFLNGQACTGVVLVDASTVTCTAPPGDGGIAQSLRVEFAATGSPRHPAVPTMTGIVFFLDFEDAPLCDGGCSVMTDNFFMGLPDNDPAEIRFRSKASWAANGGVSGNGGFASAASSGELSVANFGFDVLSGFGLTTAEFAVSVWVKLWSLDDNVYNDGRIISKATAPAGVDHDFALMYYRANGPGNPDFENVMFRLATEGGSLDVLGPVTPVLEQWHHIAATYDGSNMRIFFDGVKVAEAAHTGALLDRGYDVTIGNQPLPIDQRPLPGDIDDLFVFSQAPTEAEMMGTIVGEFAIDDQFSYAPPSITALSSDSNAVSGGYVVTLFGSSFGSGAATRTLDLGPYGSPCSTIDWVSHSEVRCTMSTSTFSGDCSTTYEWEVTLESQPSNGFGFTFEVCCGATSIAFAQVPMANNVVSGDDLTTLPHVEILNGAIRQTNPACGESSGTIDLSLDFGSGTGTLSGTATVAASAGLASFSGISVDFPLFSTGTFALTATFNALTVTSDLFTIFASAVAVVFDPEPVTAAGGDLTDTGISVQPGCRVLDVDNNVVTAGPHAALEVSLIVGSGPGPVYAAVNPVTVVAGVGVFEDVQFDVDGVFELELTIANPALGSPMSAPLNIFQAATALEWSVQPASDLSVFENVPLSVQPVVAILDKNAVRISAGPHSTLDVTLTKQTGDGFMTVDSPTVSASAGLASFSGVRFDRMDDVLLVRGDTTSPNLSTPMSNAFSVYGTATDLSGVSPTSDFSVLDGGPLLTPPQCILHDAIGSVITFGPHSALQVTLAKVSGPGAVSNVGDGLTINAVSGIAVFQNTTMDEQGDYVFRCLTSSPNLMSANLNPVTVHGRLNALEVFTQPSTTVTTFENVPIPGQPAFRLLDAHGNAIAAGAHSGLTVEIGQVSGAGTMTVDAASVAAVGGIATFSGVKFDRKSNVYAVRGRVTVENVYSPNSTPFEVYGSASMIFFSTQPSATVMTMDGMAISGQPVVQILDAFGDPILTGTHSMLDVNVVINTGPAGGGMSATPVAAVAGVATFSGISFHRQGVYDIVARTSSPLIVSAVSSPVVIHGAPMAIGITIQPVANVMANEAFSTEIEAEVLDVHGDRVATGVGSALDLTVTCDGIGSLGGACVASGTTTVSTTAGVADTFSIQIDRSGTFTLVVSSGALVSATSTPIIIFEEAAVLLFSPQPQHGGVTGETLFVEPIVSVHNAALSVVSLGPHSTVSITLTLVNGVGDLAGTLSRSASGGEAHFDDITIEDFGYGFVPGTHFRIRATCASLGLLVDSADFAVFSKLAVLGMMSSVAGNVLSHTNLTTLPVVELMDFSSVRITTGPDAVQELTAVLHGGSDNEVLLGQTTVAAVAGIAVFTDLQIDNTMSTMSGDFFLEIQCTNANCFAAPSPTAFFTIFATPTALTFDTAPVGNVLAGEPLSQSPVLTARDAENNVVAAGPLSTLEMSISMLSPSGIVIAGTTSVDAVGGQVIFGDLRVSTGCDICIANVSMVSTGTPVQTLSVLSLPFVVFRTAAHLIFTIQPVGDVLPMTAFAISPQVFVADEDFSIITTGPHAALDLSLSLSGGPSGSSVLLGNVNQTAVAGASPLFAGIFVDTTSDGQIVVNDFTLTVHATDPPLTSSSSPFTIFAVAQQLAFSVAPVGGMVSNAPLVTQPVVHTLDGFGNLITLGPHATLRCALAPDVDLTILGTVSIDSVGGVAQGFGLVLASETVVSTRIVASVPTPSLSVTSAPIMLFQSAGLLAFSVEPVGGVPSDQVMTVMPIVHVQTLSGLPILEGPHGNLTVVLELRGAQVPPAFLSDGIRSDFTNSTGTCNGFSGLQVQTNMTDTFFFRASIPGLRLFENSANFVIYAAAAALQFSADPVGDVLQGTPLSVLPAITIVDILGSTVSAGAGATTSISLSLIGGYGFESLDGTTVATTSNGVATDFAGLAVNSTSGGSDFRLNASCSDPALFALSNTFTIFAQAASIEWVTYPLGNVVAHGNLSVLPEVEILDASGRRVTVGPDSALSVSILTSVIDAFTVASETVVSAVDGVASFTSVAIKRPGVFALSVGSALISTTETPPVVIFPRATALVFATQPVGNVVGLPLSVMPEVHIVDAVGNLVTTGPHSTADVFLGFYDTAEGAVVPGTWGDTQVAGGVATFSDIAATIARSSLRLFATTTPLDGNSTANTQVPDLLAGSEPFAVYGETAVSFSPSTFTMLVDSGPVTFENHLRVDTAEQMEDVVVSVDRPELFASLPEFELFASPPNTNGTLSFSTAFVLGTATVSVRLRFGGSLFTAPATFRVTVKSDPVPTMSSISPATTSMCGGQPIDVFGSAFGRTALNLTQAFVNDTACASVSYVSASHIRCTPPFGFVPGTIAVQTTSGMSSVKANVFLGINPLPVVESIVPPIASSEFATNVTLTGHNLGTSAADLLSIDLGGGILCEAIVWFNSSRVSCTTPVTNAASSGQVVATTVSGCGGNDARVPRAQLGDVNFELVGPYVAPPPVILSVVPHNVSALYDTTILLSGLNLRAEANVTVGDRPCIDVILLAQGELQCRVPGRSVEQSATDIFKVSGMSVALMLVTVDGTAESVVFVGSALPVIKAASPSVFYADEPARLTILGDNFALSGNGTATVTVAGLACVPESVSRAEIVCQVLPGVVNGTGSVLAVDSVIGRGVATSLVTVLNPTNRPEGYQPVVLSVSPESGPIDGGFDVFVGGVFDETRGIDGHIVLVGNTMCVPTSMTGSEIVCTLAKGTSVGTSIVMVSSAIGEVGISSATFTFARPAPRILDCAPRLASRIGGIAVQIHGEYLSARADDLESVLMNDQTCQSFEWLDDETVACVVPPQSAFGRDSPHTFRIATANGMVSDDVDCGFAYTDDELVCEPSCPRRAECVDAQCVCQDGWTGQGCDARTIVIDENDISLRASEDPDADAGFVTLQLNASPSSPVTVSLEEVVAGSAQIGAVKAAVFAAGASSGGAKRATFRGRNDDKRDGLRATTLLVRCASSDPAFNFGLVDSVSVTVSDRSPVVLSIEPKLLPRIGDNVTIVAAHLDPVFSIIVGNEAVVVHEATSSARGGVRVLQSDGKLTLLVEIGAAGEGDQDVRIENGGGTMTTFTDMLFFTDSCRQEGFYGPSCKKCPEGGICPGGDRVWAQPGYWVSSEENGVVGKCDSEERCPGGQGPECGIGYTDVLCSACANGYVKSSGDVCVACPAPAGVTAYIIADALLWTAFGFTAVFVRDRELFTYCVVAVRAIQTIAGIGETATKTTPSGIRAIYDVLKLFSGDYSIVKADCFSPIPFHAQFYFAFAHSVLIFVPMFLLLLGTRVVRHHRLVRANANAIEIREEMHWFKDRLVRCVLVAITLVFLTLGTRSLQALVCVPFGETLVIQSAPETECFTGHHIPVAAVAVVLLLVLFGLPVALLLWYSRNKLGLYVDERFMEKYNFFYMQLREKQYRWFAIEFYIFATLVCAKALLPNDPMYQNTLISSGFGAKLLAVVLIKPFELASDNTLQAIISFFALVATNYNFLVSLGILDTLRDVSPVLGYLVMLVAFAVLVVLVVILILQIRKEAEYLAALRDGRAFELGDNWKVDEAAPSAFAYSFDSSIRTTKDNGDAAKFKDMLVDAATLRVIDEGHQETAEAKRHSRIAQRARLDAERRDDDAFPNPWGYFFGDDDDDDDAGNVVLDEHELADIPVILGEVDAWARPGEARADDFYRSEDADQVRRWRETFAQKKREKMEQQDEEDEGLW